MQISAPIIVGFATILLVGAIVLLIDALRRFVQR